jgi:OmpR-family two-component system manganese-sensing sensor histidine kinase
MFQSTRRRLALWYAVATGILLLLFATGFYLYVRSTLIERVDDTLSHVVEVVERSLAVEPITTKGTAPKLRVNPDLSFRNDTATVEDDHIDLEWFSAAGTPLWSTFPEVLDIPLTTKQQGQTVAVAPGYALRQVTKPVAFDGQLLGYLRVSHPWFEVTKPTRQLVVDLTMGGIITIAFVATIAWFLSGLAIAPVRESYQQLKRFTADASHELRSPIASIQTNVQVALADPNVDDRERRNWQVVERLTQRLGRLVDDLLFLARQDGGSKEAELQCCALDALVLEVVEEQQMVADEQDVALLFDIGDPPAGSSLEENLYGLWADEAQLARLLTNLIDNAIRYTPAAGKVRVDLRRVVRAGNPHVQLQVSDTGVGIPAADLSHVFERFYRVDRARSHSDRASTGEGDVLAGQRAGSGLGLAIAQTIVERHRGQIGIESVAGQGTTVTVTLPLTKQEVCAHPDLVG